MSDTFLEMWFIQFQQVQILFQLKELYLRCVGRFQDFVIWFRAFTFSGKAVKIDPLLTPLLNR